MKKFNSFKGQFLIFLLIFQSLLIFGTFLTFANAKEYIPEESIKNGWYWDVQEGDKLIFEVEQVIMNGSTPTEEFINANKYLQIYNITSFENITDNLSVYPYPENFSVINANSCFWNKSSQELISLREESIAFFGYNETSPIPEKYFTQNLIYCPIILPINGSKGLEIDVMADIINRSLLNFMYEAGQLNKFNESFTSDDNNFMSFVNETDGYYFNLTFYDNGTLKSAETRFKFQVGDNEFNILEQKLTRVFSMDDTDEVDWDYSVGDVFYYDFIEGPNPDLDDANRIKVNITSINYTSKSFDNGNIYYRNLETIYGDVYFWNGTSCTYDLEFEWLIGQANNFYPLYPSEFETLISFTPKNILISDLDFIFNENIDKVFSGEYDNASVIETSNNFIITMESGSGSGIQNITIDKVSGFVNERISLDDTNAIVFYYVKPYTNINWSCEVGDIFHIKLNDLGLSDRIYYKIVVSEINILFLNLTQIELDSGGQFDFPDDQPELQFFSYVGANFYDEDGNLDLSKNCIGMANDYWATSPLIFQMYYPILIPIGTDPQDLQSLTSITETYYDTLSYTDDYIEFTNSTEQKSLKFCLESSSGLMTYIGGWMPIYGPPDPWEFSSMYTMSNLTLNSGSNIDQLDTYFDINGTTELNITLTAGKNSFYYSLLEDNPINETVPEGIIFGYYDFFCNNTDNISPFLINVSIDNVTPLNDTLYFYAYNMSGEETWALAPPDELAALIIANTSSYLTMNLTSMVSEYENGMIFVISYDIAESEGGDGTDGEGPEDEEPEDDEPDGGPGGEIPGPSSLTIIFILLTAISLIAISRYKKVIYY